MMIRVWTAVITKWLEDHQPSLDWTDSQFGRNWAPQILFEFATMATQSMLYWMVSFRMLCSFYYHRITL